MTFRGFTLVELLVVVAIIGVLAGALVMGLNPLTQFKKTRDARRKSNLQEIKTSLQLYHNIEGAYPTSSGGQIVGCGAGPAACGWGSAWSRNGVTIMRILPADPLATQSYSYTRVDADSFYILATLEMGDDDGDASESRTRCGQGGEDQYAACSD